MPRKIVTHGIMSIVLIAFMNEAHRILVLMMVNLIHIVINQMRLLLTTELSMHKCIVKSSIYENMDLI